VFIWHSITNVESYFLNNVEIAGFFFDKKTSRYYPESMRKRILSDSETERHTRREMTRLGSTATKHSPALRSLCKLSTTDSKLGRLQIIRYPHVHAKHPHVQLNALLEAAQFTTTCIYMCTHTYVMSLFLCVVVLDLFQSIASFIVSHKTVILIGKLRLLWTVEGSCSSIERHRI
jgi:hypothetical protein